jgi:hypothetical protein
MHNRALLLQQPRRNSYGIRVHLTYPDMFAMSPLTAATRNIHNSTCCEWVGTSKEDSTRTVDDGGEMVQPRVVLAAGSRSQRPQNSRERRHKCLWIA